MKKFMFETDATMKEYNCKNWWIDRDIIPAMTIQAETLKSALEMYRQRVNDNYTIEISNNALKTKQAMYRDCKDGSTKQVGFVITGKDDYFLDETRNKYTTQYINLWIEIVEISDIDFDAA